MLNPRRFTAAVFFSASALLMGCAGMSGNWQDSRFKETRNATLSHAAGQPVRVETANGSVKIVAANVGDVQVKSEIRATTKERLEAAKLVLERDAKGVLVVRFDWPAPGRQGNEGASVELLLPDARDIHVKTSNGAITIEGLDGSAQLKTSNGPIRVQDQDGPVTADTSNAAIEITGAGGPINADTSNGPITIMRAPAAVKADTSNSAIYVDLLPTNPGPATLDTSNGGVTFSFGPAFRGVIKAGTSNGHINLDNVKAKELGKRSARVEVGDNPEAAPASTIDTSNGSITIRKQGE